eukprot:CAMPEP_0172058118 /NCGR_PEP_ID=MMETSP1043-20130122/6684_1 /TAXON_ID=464988 /ORGANISM="Hemiselmis andersenii, Strain CCMP441" /LENGTH=111 /DNA_ID=CAMNT_0012717643 /DNA_START=31 /DNA_END=366 /DNA_ORIENTATION=-
MYTKIALLGLIGSAAAFNAPMMTTRRDAVAAGTAAAVAAPLLRPGSAKAAYGTNSKAPVITIFDERDGCPGPLPNKARGEDGLCLKVFIRTIDMNVEEAKSVITNFATPQL